MALTEREILVRYQVSLFTGLAGVMIAKKLCTRREIASALELVSSAEPSEPVTALLDMTIAALIRAPSPTEPEAQSAPVAFTLIAGGLE